MSAGSLHQRILAETLGRIGSGEWPPGHRIPFEHELTAQYGCSRMTVNKVLTQLAQAGVIERRRKAGSFVAQRHRQSAVLEIQEIDAEVASMGLPYRFQILARRRGRGRLPLDLEQPGPQLVIRCLHLAGDTPFCLEDRTISLTAVPEAADEPFSARPPGSWLMARVPWTEAEHRIRAEPADPATAMALGLATGSPCLVIERRTWRGELPVTHVQLTYPGPARELVARFRPSQSG